jgi:hypothetical protein
MNFSLLKLLEPKSTSKTLQESRFEETLARLDNRILESLIKRY